MIARVARCYSFYEWRERVTTGQKIALASVAAFIVAVGGELLYLKHRNAEDANVQVKQRGAFVQGTISDDDEVSYNLKKLRPDSLKDMRDLVGKDVWVQAGGQMDYYKDSGNHVNYGSQVGTLPGAEDLLVKGVFEQAGPPKGRAQFRLGEAQKYVMLAFTEPKESDSKTLYALPIGVYKSDGYTFFSDQVLFYDDPHVLYKHWGPQMWQAIDKHQAVVGMTEPMAMMSMGQVITPHGDKVGDRSVTYDNYGHPVDMDFVNGKAVKVTPEK